MPDRSESIGVIHYSLNGKVLLYFHHLRHTAHEIVAAKNFGACHQSRRKRLVVAVPFAYGPGPFKDFPSGQGDVENAEVPLSIVTQGMGFFRYDEAAGLELIVYFTEDPAVRQRKPRFRVSGCGYFP